jgi:hypothetical protein
VHVMSPSGASRLFKEIPVSWIPSHIPPVIESTFLRNGSYSKVISCLVYLCHSIANAINLAIKTPE